MLCPMPTTVGLGGVQHVTSILSSVTVATVGIIARAMAWRHGDRRDACEWWRVLQCLRS